MARTIWEDLEIGRSFTKARSGHPELERVGNNLFIFSFKSMDEGRYIPHKVEEVWAFSGDSIRVKIGDIDSVREDRLEWVTHYRLYTVPEEVHRHETFVDGVKVLLLEYPSANYLKRVNAHLLK